MPRPSRHESEGRRREFVRLVARGWKLDDAARAARLDPWRALRFVDSPEMRAMLATLTGCDVTTAREDFDAEVARVPG